MAKRLCVRPGLQSTNFLPDQLRQFVHPWECASLAAVCRAFAKPFRVAHPRWHAVRSLFGFDNNFYDEDDDDDEDDISAYLEDVDGLFKASVGGQVDWLADRVRWKTLIQRIRVLWFTTAWGCLPRLWNEMPTLENLSKLTMMYQPWFSGALVAAKMPNLTSLDLIVRVSYKTTELDLSGFPKLRRLCLRNDGSDGKIDVDLPRTTLVLTVDASFFVRSGSETVERLTVNKAQDPFFGKFVLAGAKWPALTQLRVTSPMVKLSFPDGPLPLREFDFKNERVPGCPLAKVCKPERLVGLTLTPVSVNDVWAFPGAQLSNLQELTLTLPNVTKARNNLAPLVAVCGTLKWLVIRTNSFDCELDMESIGKLRHLETLHLQSTSSTLRAALRHLEGCQELRHLVLDKMVLDDRPASSFVLPKLETLALDADLKTFFRIIRVLPGMFTSVRRLTLACLVARGGTSRRKLFERLRCFKRLEWLDLRRVFAAHVSTPSRTVELDNWLPPACTILPCVTN